LLGTPIEELRALDTRPALNKFNRLARTDPTFSYALRQIVENE